MREFVDSANILRQHSPRMARRRIAPSHKLDYRTNRVCENKLDLQIGSIQFVCRRSERAKVFDSIVNANALAFAI